MKSHTNFSVSGEVHVVKTDRDGNVTGERKFNNLVLDVGLAELLRRWCEPSLSEVNETTAYDLVKYLYLGTGTTGPTRSDAGLENRSGTLAGKRHKYNYNTHEAGNVVDENNNYYEFWTKLWFTYGEGEAEGVWTELGLADNLYANPFSRALFKDENGAPISLQVLSDEFLSVFYTLRFAVEPAELPPVTIAGYSVTPRFVPNVYYYDNGDTFYRYPFISPSEIGPLSELHGMLNAPTSSYNKSLSFSFSSDPYYGNGIPQSGALTYPGTGLTATGNFVVDPTASDTPLAAIMLMTRNGNTQLSDNDPMLGAIIFDPPATKLADYRLTVGVDLTLLPQGDPVEGLSHTATSSLLDFTWDAYPAATEYQLVLRQAGTVISSQTVTAPTATASFTGLTATTEYHLDIKPVTASYNGRRLIYAATTGAA